MRNVWCSAVLALGLAGSGAGAGAQWVRAGRLDDSVPRMEFGSEDHPPARPEDFASRPLGFAIDYHGNVSDQAVVCTPGYVILGGLAPGGTCLTPYVQFGDSVSRFDELAALRGQYGSVMAPDFTRISTALENSIPPDTNGQVFTSTDPVRGLRAWSATWHSVRAKYNAPNDAFLTFQLAIIRLGAERFVMEYNYGALGWYSEGGAGWVDDGAFTGTPVRAEAFAPGVIPSDSRFACLFVDGAAERCAVDVDFTTTPEPGTVALFGAGLTPLCVLGVRRQRGGASRADAPGVRAPGASLVPLALAAGSLSAGACADPTAVRPDALPLAPARPALARSASAQPAHAQYLVLLKSGARGPSPDALRVSGAVARGRLRYVNGTVYDHVADPTALAADPAVTAVVENYRFHTSAAGGDAVGGAAFSYQSGATFERRGWQWNMHQIRADSAPAAVTGAGARVCIVDSGIDDTHQDLAGKVIARESFLTVANGYAVASPDPRADSVRHGSHVAGTVTSNGVGVAGVAPGARLLNARVFDGAGSGTAAAILDGMAWCRANRADVVDMSFGASFALDVRQEPFVQQLRDLYTEHVSALRADGAVVIAAAGNDQGWLDPAADWVVYPAQIPGVVAVAATAPGRSLSHFPFPMRAPNAGFDGNAFYSNLGASVGLFAPGGAIDPDGLGLSGVSVQSGITSVCSGARPGCEGGRLYMSIAGTSMAAPHAAGVAALITGRTHATRGLARTQAVEHCLTFTGDAITVSSYLYNLGPVQSDTALRTVTRPRVNARRAATERCPGI